MKKTIFLTALICLFSSQKIEALNYPLDAGGYGYSDMRMAGSCLGPAIPLTIVVVAAVTAVLLQDTHGGSGHSH